MYTEKWESQIAEGTLEYAVMLLLKRREYYGYEIAQSLNNFDILSTSESTVNPLLRRLEKLRYLESYWKESKESIPPRKYYSLTKQGTEYLNSIDSKWQELVGAIDTYL